MGIFEKWLCEKRKKKSRFLYWFTCNMIEQLLVLSLELWIMLLLLLLLLFHCKENWETFIEEI